MANATVGINFVIKEGKDGLKTLTVDADGLRKAMTQTLEVTDRMQRQIGHFSLLSTGLRNSSDALGQLSSTITFLTDEYRGFDSAMKGANTMAGKDAAGFGVLKDQVSDLAKEIPVARDLLAGGLYQTISNGVPEDNWIDFLRTSARAAVGGMADLEKVVGVTSTVIKNYGAGWEEAGAIQDKIQLTAKNGVTSFEQLSEALPRVTGNAATLGVSIDELLATFSTLTGVSGNTAEVSTQLAAIFTSLVKPSSEAAQMAAEMGIQFDAAAIKAAGGLQNFLQQLDKSVRSYSAASGVLEQEVYGKLFGSAEALRALGPLQGELSAKFNENVAAMQASAGTMDAAYETMASTGESAAQRLRNYFADLTDGVNSMISSMAPIAEFSANTLETALSVVTLTKGMQSLVKWQQISRVATIASTRAMGALSTAGVYARAMLTALTAKFTGAAVGATTMKVAMTGLKIAIKGLLISSGVGLAIVALTSVVEALMNASDETADATDRLSEAERRAKESSEDLQEAHAREAENLRSARSQIEQHIATLGAFNGTKQEEQTLVSRLNSTYGETMGYFSSAVDWYKALVANSDAYCKQMVIEAYTRRMADRIAEKKQNIWDLTHDERGNARKFSTAKNVRNVPTTATSVSGEVYDTTKQVVDPADYERAVGLVREEKAAIAALEKEIRRSAKEAASIRMPVTGAPAPPRHTSTGAGSKKGGKGGSSRSGKQDPVLRGNAEILSEITENIDYYEAQLDKARVDSRTDEWHLYKEQLDAANERNAQLMLRNAETEDRFMADLKEREERFNAQTDYLRGVQRDLVAALERESAHTRRIGELQSKMAYLHTWVCQDANCPHGKPPRERLRGQLYKEDAVAATVTAPGAEALSDCAKAEAAG